MFHHLTLIRLRPDSPSGAVVRALEAARELERAIPSVLAMSCGEALAADGHEWQMAFEFSFDDPGGFERFASHQAHETFVQQHVHPYLESIVSVDYYDRPLSHAEAFAPPAVSKTIS